MREHFANKKQRCTKCGIRTDNHSYRWEWSTGSWIREYRYEELSHDGKSGGGGGGSTVMFCLWGWLRYWRRGY